MICFIYLFIQNFQQQQQGEWFNNMQNTSKVKRRMKQIQQQVIFNNKF